MGTAGGAVTISILALLISITFPLYLERRREKREDRRRLEASWRRITEATGQYGGELKNADIYETDVLEGWLNAIFFEISSPDGVLWQHDEAFEAVRELQRAIREYNRFRRPFIDSDDPEDEELVWAERDKLQDLAMETLDRVYAAAEERMFPGTTPERPTGKYRPRV